MTFLKDIAFTFTGHTIRFKVENNPGGDCVVIQTKDISERFAGIDANALNKIFVAEVPPHQQLNKDDILLLSKGTKNRAILYSGSHQYAVATSAFTIIRLKSTHLLPGYLAWYLNSKPAQDYFNANRAGTTTLNLLKQAIDQLEVPVPPVQLQEKMLNLINTTQQYRYLLEEYTHHVHLLTETILQKQIKQQ